MRTFIKHSIIVSLFLFTFLPVKSQLNLDNLLSTGAKILQNATTTTNFNAEDLVGTWIYSSPAVAFKGDNALSNIGGAAASATVENKLETYYKKVGIQNAKLTVKSDLSFSWNLGKVTLSGTISKSKDSQFLVFNFSAFGKVKIGSINCIASKSGSTVSLTFDSSKLLALAKQISSISSNSSFQTVNSLLSNYKDLYVGLKMKKN